MDNCWRSCQVWLIWTNFTTISWLLTCTNLNSGQGGLDESDDSSTHSRLIKKSLGLFCYECFVFIFCTFYKNHLLPLWSSQNQNLLLGKVHIKNSLELLIWLRALEFTQNLKEIHKNWNCAIGLNFVSLVITF